MKTEIFVKVTDDDGQEWTRSWTDDGDVSVGDMKSVRDPLRVLRKITKRIEYKETEEAKVNAEKNDFARDLSTLYKGLTTVGVMEKSSDEIVANKELLRGFLLAKNIGEERQVTLFAACVNAGNLFDEGASWRLKKW